MNYPKEFDANRKGTFTLNGLQLGIEDLSYHAMNDAGVYEVIMNVRKVAGTYDFNSHLEMMRLEAVRLENAGCIVDKKKKLTVKQSELFNVSVYPGRIFLTEAEIQELKRVKNDDVAFEKMLKFLHIKTGGGKQQLLREFNSYVKAKK